MNGKWLLTGIFLITPWLANAQQFGGFPPSTKWRQITTDTARIIYEQAIDSQAQNIAAIIHQATRINPAPLGDKVRRINVLLHKNTTLANGYVALGPFRSEYYLIPGSNLFEFGSTPWQQTLAVHEHRHVHQYSNFNRGISRVASVIFGQEGQAAFNAISIPDWFFEGDAVHSETVQTFQGRGRAPHFFNGFRALWHERRNYSWMKLRNGSLKDYVPNHYPLGYLLVNYGYQKYGPQFWRNVTQDALSLRGFFGFFGGSIKRYSGTTWRQFRRDALEYYRHEVSTRRDATTPREVVTDYLFPQQVGEDSLVYIKSGYRQLPAFYLKDQTGEHRIKLRSITSEDWFSYRNGTIAYTAYSTSARWSLINYSNIVLLDVATGREKKLTANARYFTPDIRPDGAQLLAVAFTDSLQSELHFLNLRGGVEKSIKAPPGALFVHPRYINNNQFVVAVRQANSTMSIQRGNITTGQMETVLQPQAVIMGYPFVQDNKLYFVSSQSGNDDIYELDLNGPLPARRMRQLTFGQTGNYFPTVRNDTVVWSRFTSNGHRLQKAALAQIKAITISGDELAKRGTPFPIALQEAPNVLVQPSREFDTDDYKKTAGIFNVHSWRPNYTDPEITYSLYSNNVLNTFRNQLFYRYNINETSHGIGLNSSYGGWFPVINAGFTYTFNRTIKTTSLTYTLNQLEARLGYNIPLNFSQGKTYKFVNFGSNYVYNQLKPAPEFRNRLSGRTANYLHHFLSYSQQLPKAVQHIYPKFAYTLNAQHRHLLGNFGYQFLTGASLYLPSIRNHSIVLAANFQKTDTANSTFSNRFANSRGYNDFYFPRMWRLSGNYHMPLFYPDKGIPGILYFLRIRTNFFYDFTRVFDRRENFANQRSVGGEMFFDTKLFNTLPATIGIRLSHLLDNDFSRTRAKGSTIFEVVLPLDIIPQ
jgi:hypothetical protein